MTARAGYIKPKTGAAEPAEAGGPSLAAEEMFGATDLTRALANDTAYLAAARCFQALVSLFGEPEAREAVKAVLAHKPMARSKATRYALPMVRDALKAAGVRNYMEMAAETVGGGVATASARRRINRAKRRPASSSPKG